VLGPLYWASSDKERSLAAVPLFFATWKRGDFAQRHRFALIPAFYYSRHAGRTTSLCTPLFGFSATPRSRLWYAGPYLGYRSESTDLDTAPPLFVRHRDKARQRTTLFALPGYYGRWSPQGSAHVFAPLVWRFSSADRDSTVVFPAVWDFRRRGVSRTTVVFPLYWRHRDVRAGRTTHVVPPVWVRTRQRRLAAGGGRATDAVVFPLFWHFAGDEPGRGSTVAFPLYWSFSRGARRSTVIFPLYWDFARGSRRTTVAVNTIYIRDTAAGTYDFHFLPLLRVQRKRPTDFKISFVAGLFGYERIGRNRRIKLLLIPIQLKPTPRQTGTRARARRCGARGPAVRRSGRAQSHRAPSRLTQL